MFRKKIIFINERAQALIGACALFRFIFPLFLFELIYIIFFLLTSFFFFTYIIFFLLTSFFFFTYIIFRFLLISNRMDSENYFEKRISKKYF